MAFVDSPDVAGPPLRRQPDSHSVRLEASRQKHRAARGRSVRTDYLLTGIAFCGVCGSRLIGFTKKSSKGYRTPYYVCGGRHNGNHDACPNRYTVPAKTVEGHILSLIKADLAKLKTDSRLIEHVKEVVRRLTGRASDSAVQLERRLADITKQLAGLQEHLMVMDAETAKGMGLYAKAEGLVEEKSSTEKRLAEVKRALPKLPSEAVIRSRAAMALDEFEATIESAPLEQRREMVRTYVEKIEADPDSQTVRISLFSPLFSSVIVWSTPRSVHAEPIMLNHARGNKEKPSRTRG